MFLQNTTILIFSILLQNGGHEQHLNFGGQFECLHNQKYKICECGN